MSAAPLDLSTVTTFRVGGPAADSIAPTTTDDLVADLLRLWGEGEPVLLLGGGSNVLVSDDGFDGTLVRVVTRGLEILESGRAGVVRIRVEAGESWDGLVATTVERGWAGIEALSGIPGSVGASPIQNIGAYGQELASTLVAVDFLDEATGERERIPAAELALGYRTSIFKQGRSGAVLAIELDLVDRSSADEIDGASVASSEPIAYAQLAGALGVELGARVPLAEVRASVLAVRGSKGMVLDAGDPDTAGAGSFFTNPIVSADFARSLPGDAPRWPVDPTPAASPAAGADGVTPLELVDAGYPITLPERTTTPASAEPLVKLSAAWLIERSGISRGFRLPGSAAAISSKHTLALTNQGGASSAEVAELARFVQSRVAAEFGVWLHPEPVLVGASI